MSKAYQVITEQGLVIPPALCATAQLGGEVLLEIEPGKIAIRPVRISAEEAQRRALRYLLTTLGDALSLGAPSLLGQNAEAVWSFTISRSATGEIRGELRLNAETGEVIAWLPASATLPTDPS
ncbi:MAG: hypothetical protein ACREBD_36175 [Blastocatellia bacterium]